MNEENVLRYIEEEDVRFVRLVFFDASGVQKNISVQPDQMERVMASGMPVDASSIPGFDNPVSADLLLHPDLSTLEVLPWRSTDGTVISFICDVTYPDGTPYGKDGRHILRRAVEHARALGLAVWISSEIEFYLFHPGTRNPLDTGGYLDVAPLDHGEDVRREICFALAQMGLQPQASYHQAGPGQNEIDFHASPALRAADETSLFKYVVRTVAYGNGLEADFSPKPLKDEAGSGMHLNLVLSREDFGEEVDPDVFSMFLAGILNRIPELTACLNPAEQSYARLGKMKAPDTVCWSERDRHQLVRVHAGNRLELRSPDSLCNPYVAFALLIEAGLAGIENREGLMEPDLPAGTLPASLQEAQDLFASSLFVQSVLG